MSNDGLPRFAEPREPARGGRWLSVAEAIDSPSGVQATTHRPRSGSARRSRPEPSGSGAPLPPEAA